jgi:excisionase family DNA binding protein
VPLYALASREYLTASIATRSLRTRFTSAKDSAMTEPTPEREHPPSSDATFAMRLLTIPEVAEMCGLSQKSIRRAIDRGDLPAMKLCSRLRIAPGDVAAWYRGNLVVPTDTDALFADPRGGRRRRRRPPAIGGLRELLDEQ